MHGVRRGVGAADPADASFSLRTNVGAGAESANAVTDSRSVCDRAGNCATAGPVTGFRVDRLAPAIGLTFSGARTVARDADLRVSYTCADGGSGVQSCAGDAASGAALDTSTPGIHAFHVTATDAAGNTATRTATYIVSTSSSPSGPFQVAGTVSDQAGSSAMLAGSTVEAFDAGTSTLRATASVGGDGSYLLSVASGTYDIRVTPPSGAAFLPSTAASVAVQSDTALDFVLLTGTGTGPTPTPTATMSGTIRDPNHSNMALAGITVSDGSSSVVTGAGGTYALTTTRGAHVFTVAGSQDASHPGFSAQFALTLSGDATQDIDLPTSRLTVHAVDAADGAAAGGAVSYAAALAPFSLGSGLSLLGGSEWASGTTSAGGDAVLAVLPAAASANDWVRFGTGSPYRDTAFAVPALSADTTVTATVQSFDATVTGHIRDLGHAPYANLGIRIDGRSTRTDSSGFFSLLTTSGTHTLQLTGGGGTTDFTLDVPLTAAAGTNDEEYTLPFSLFNINFSDAQGAPVAGGTVAFSAPISPFQITPGVIATGDGPQHGQSVTGSNGRVVFFGLPTPGSAANSITFDPASPYADTTWTVPAATASGAYVDITVPRLDASFSGVVQDEAGDPLPGVGVAVAGRSATTDAQGRYRLYAASGSHTLTVTSSSPAATLRAPITLNGGDTTTSLTLPTKRLVVRVLDSAGAPIGATDVSVDAPAGDVTLAPGLVAVASGHQTAAGATDSHGEARLTVLPTTGGAGAGHVAPPGGLGLSAAAFALPAINTDTLLVVQYQGNGRSVATGPTVTCDPAPSGWQADNVAVACAAAAAPPATLADPGDAHFTLSTSVPDGTQTANASTGSHQVCDSNGICATAAAIGPIRVDRKAPSATVTAPADGATYTRGQNVAAAYGCTDGSDGSGIVTSGGCVGPVTAGSPVDTATAGSHTFAVTATDGVGHTATKTVSYTVSSGSSAVCGAGSTDTYCQAVAATQGLANYFALDGTATRDPVGGVTYTPIGANFAAATGPRGETDRALHIINYAGTGRGSIQLTPSVNMSGTRPWTIEAWWKEGTDVSVAPHDQTLFGRFYDTGPTGCLGSPAACMHMNTAPGMRSVVARGDASVISAPWASVSDSDGSGAPQWTLLAVTYDGGTLRLFKDGVLQGQVASTVALPANPITMFLTSNDAYWAKLAIYDHAVSAAELLTHYQSR